MISHKPVYGHQTTLHTPPKKKHEGHSQEDTCNIWQFFLLNLIFVKLPSSNSTLQIYHNEKIKMSFNIILSFF